MLFNLLSLYYCLICASHVDVLLNPAFFFFNCFLSRDYSTDLVASRWHVCKNFWYRLDCRTTDSLFVHSSDTQVAYFCSTESEKIVTYLIRQSFGLLCPKSNRHQHNFRLKHRVCVTQSLWLWLQPVYLNSTCGVRCPLWLSVKRHCFT